MNTDTTKRYRLLINLPDGAIIGDTYKKVGDRYFNERLDAIKSPVVEHNAYFTWQVENCPTYFEEVLPVSEPVKEGVDKQKIFQSVLKTLKNNKVMVDTREDGIYVRLAGKESLGEAFTLHFGLVYPFYAQPSALNDTVVEDKCLFDGERINKYLMDEFGQTGKTEPLRFQKRYSQKEVDTIRKEAFEAGRHRFQITSCGTLGAVEFRYPNYSDYLSSLNLNTNDISKDQNDKGNYTPPLSEIKEGEDKPVLFTTEDGVDIKIGDDYWVWDFGELNNIHRVNKASRTHTGSGIYRKYFSTKEAAEQYIIDNKPCLSLNDVMKFVEPACHPSEENFDEIGLRDFVTKKLKSLNP